MDSVAEVYLSNYEIVGALAQEHGFKYFFFWQPVVSVGDKTIKVRAGESYYIPPGSDHVVWTENDEPNRWF
jgi:mannose-6-phosphate isomerase-like protein (cupin superfamily)